MSNPDYYAELGVERNDTPDVIKKAYRKLAMKYHPDRTKGDKEKEAKFKLINAAYEVLSDSAKKQEYDTFGTVGGQGAGAYAQGFNVDIGDIFSQMFGGGGGGRRTNINQAYKGADIEMTLRVSLEQVIAGAQQSFKIDIDDACSSCEGSGVDRDAQATTCGNCQGAGEIASGSGFFSFSQTCPSCGGAGRSRPVCKPCRGKRTKRAKQPVSLSIPQGVEEGQYLRLRGKGNGGLNGGPAGDLFMKVEIKKHPVFERDGLNLHCSMPVSMVDAILGAKLTMQTITGDTAEIDIPAGSQPNHVIQIAKQGIPSNRAKGHLYIELDVQLPKKLNDKQKEALQAFSSNEKAWNKEKNDWLDRINKYASKVSGYMKSQTK